jgi:hypothetical protein
MRKATRIVASWLGLLAGVSGLEHGYFEILQGNTKPSTFMFASMGPPCVPERIWNACEPAMTVLPNFLVAGILTVILGLLVMTWSAAFVQRKNGGRVLILLSVILLLLGGGFFPPLIGIVGGVAGTRINKPLGRKPAGSMLLFAARLWPWPLVVLIVWLLGQFPVGYFFNDFLLKVIGFGLLLILVMLPGSVYTAYARDALLPAEGEEE